MSVNSVIRLNSMRIRQLQRAQVTALEKTAEELHQNLQQSQTMPFDVGTLQGEGTFVDCSESFKGHVSIVSSTSYARRLYYHPEYNFSTIENPNAGARWFDPYLDGGPKDKYAREVFNEFYKKESGV